MRNRTGTFKGDVEQEMSKILRTILSDASGKAVVVLLIAGVGAFLAIISVLMARTSSTGYCISCHEMARYKDELKYSSHAVTKEKTPIECKDCHIPNSIGGKYLIVKTVLGMKDLAVHYFGDPENLNRREMQAFARRFVPDENCLACHQDLMKDTKDKPLSEIGRLSHQAYLGENGQTSRGCAGCHFNMAHLPDFDRRYHFNAEFAKRFPLKKEQ